MYDLTAWGLMCLAAIVGGMTYLLPNTMELTNKSRENLEVIREFHRESLITSKIRPSDSPRSRAFSSPSSSSRGKQASSPTVSKDLKTKPTLPLKESSKPWTADTQKSMEALPKLSDDATWPNSAETLNSLISNWDGDVVILILCPPTFPDCREMTE